jgi:hypothetical protein
MSLVWKHLPTEAFPGNNSSCNETRVILKKTVSISISLPHVQWVPDGNLTFFPDVSFP